MSHKEAQKAQKLIHVPFVRYVIHSFETPHRSGS